MNIAKDTLLHIFEYLLTSPEVVLGSLRVCKAWHTILIQWNAQCKIVMSLLLIGHTKKLDFIVGRCYQFLADCYKSTIPGKFHCV